MSKKMARKRTRSSRRSDAIIGYLVPIFFMALAGYQQITQGAVDKYVIGGLLVFGLGALGWRIDILFDKYLESRIQRPENRGHNKDGS